MKIKDFFKGAFNLKNPPKLLFNTYILIIILGSILLALPISSSTGEFTKFSDSFFTATSALCVTGLSTVVTAVHWSWFGKLVILILIQLGGLGVMTAAAAVGLLINIKFTVAQRINLAEEKNTLSMEGIIRLLKYIFMATFLIEILGAVFLSITFIPEFGLARGIAFSIFHSISAFCNAGFDLIGSSSLVPYGGKILFLPVIMVLIVSGGLGFGVFQDIKLNRFNFKKYRVHTKVVVLGTVVLLVLPSIAFLVLEWTNPSTIGPMTFGKKILTSIFQAITPRTAGFFTVEQGNLRNASTILMFILMFIGGAPAGTAGGLKITTITTVYLTVRSLVKNEKDLVIFNRRLPEDVGKKSVAILIISLTWIFGIIFLLSITDNGNSLTDIVFEVISAYGTVGLTRGLTSSLTVVGKFLIAATMVFGKIGPLAIIFAFKKKSLPKAYREAEEAIIVG